MATGHVWAWVLIGASAAPPPELRKQDMQVRMVHRWLHGIPVVSTPDTHETAGRMAGLAKEAWGYGCIGPAYRLINTGGGPLFLDRLPYLPTPHRPWARPYSLGRLKVLYVNDTYAIGEASLLEQRGDLEVYVYTIPAHLGWIRWWEHKGYGEFLIQRMRELLAVGPDVIVVHNQMGTRPEREWTLPPEVHGLILERVQAGAGLVFFPRHDARCVADAADVFSRACPLRYTGQYIGTPGPEPGLFAGSHPITEGLPLELLAGQGGYLVKSQPAAGAEAAVTATRDRIPWLAVGRHGRGRTVAFGYSASRLVPERGPGYAETTDQVIAEERYEWEEYAYALVLRAIVWAAGKEPRVRLKTTGPASLKPSETLRPAIELTHTGQAPLTVNVRLTVRGDEADIIDEQTRSVTLEPDKAQVVDMACTKRLRPGLHLVDIALTDPQGHVENWGAIAVRVEGPVRLSVKTDKEFYQPGDTVGVTTRVEGAGLQGLTLRTELWDTYGRLMTVDERRLPDGTSPETVKLSLQDAVGWVFDVKSRLLHEGDCLAQTITEVTVPRYDWGDDWCNKLWAGADPILNRVYRAMGINALSGGAYAHRLGGLRRNARAGFPTWLRSVEPHPTSSYARGPDDDQHAILALDPNRIAKEKAAVAEAAKTIRRYGTLGFILTGEKAIYYDSSYDEFSLAGFKRFVRDTYKTLEALNAQWGTSYRTWEEVGPVKTEAWRRRQTANFSQWMDFRRFMDKTHTEADTATAGWWAEHLGRAVPVGHDQSFGLYQHTIPYGCHDYYGMLSGGLTAWISYQGGDSGVFTMEQNNYNASIQGFEWLAVRSWCKGPMMGLGGWLGGGLAGWFDYTGRSWSVLFNGGCGMDWYEPSMFFAGYTALTPNGARIEEATREIRAGIGKALLTAQRRTDPVAIWQDMTNEYAAWLMNLPGAGFSRWDIVTALHNNGIKPVVVSDRQIEAGALADVRLLYLPSITCVSRRAAEQVRGFVERGGVVVADIGAGSHDEHGKPLEQGYLDAVFGIRRSQMTLVRGQAQAVYTRRHPKLPLKTGTLALGFDIHWYDDMPAGTFEADLKPDGVMVCGEIVSSDKRLAKAPAFLINPLGKGHALFLNFLPTPYVYQGKADVAVYDLVRAILHMAGVQPEVRLAAGEEPVRFFDINRFRRKMAWYVGVLRYPDKTAEPSAVRVHLPAAGHVYELRSHGYYGQAQAVTERFRPGDFDDAVRVYAVVPYRIQGVDLRVSGEVKRGQAATWSAVVRGADGTADHVLRVEVADAQGERPWYLQQNVLALGGRYEGRLPLALNDKPGTWRLRVTDVISGLSVEEPVEVR